MQKSLTGNSNWKLAVYSGGKETVLGRLGRISLTDKKLKLVALSSGGDIKGQNEQQAGRADSLDKIRNFTAKRQRATFESWLPHVLHSREKTHCVD